LEQLGNLGGFAAVGGTVFIVIVVLAAVLATVAKYYKKVSPNQVAVITGRKYGKGDAQRGFRSVVGGGLLLVPILEKMEIMHLNVIPVPVTVNNVPDKNGALVTVDAIANIKIRSEEDVLPLAIERFLGKDDRQITEVAKQTLEGNLRAIVGTMQVEELLSDRQAFMSKVLEEAGADLAKMGLGVDVLKIQNINDTRGYIESLGKKRTAEVVRDAAIGEAEAQRETDIKSAAARQEGETAKAKADQAVSDAQRERDIAIADNEAEVKARQAMIPIAAQIAEAERNKELNTAAVGAEQAQVEAQIGLEEVRARRNAAEQHATVVVPAEKEKEARIIRADAEREAAEREGEAARIKAEKQGQGEQARMTAEAEGRKAAAAADQAELVAKAEGRKAELLATAAGTQAELEAKAVGELKLAEALAAKAEALKQLDESGRFLMILEALPPVIDAVGIALERASGPMAKAIGEGLGNIDEIKIVDLGGGNVGQDGRSVLGRFAHQPAETMFALWQRAQALGLGPVIEAAADKLGIDVKKFVEFPRSLDVPVPSAGAAEPTPEPSPAAETAPAETAPAASGTGDAKS